MAIPRMRTRDKAIELLRQEDPETNLTRNAINGLIKSGKLPTTKIGNKVLINYDFLLELMAAGVDGGETTKKEVGTIRRVDI